MGPLPVALRVKAINRRDLSGRGDLGTGPLGLVGNVIWFLVAGWWRPWVTLSSALACFVVISPFGIRTSMALVWPRRRPW